MQVVSGSASLFNDTTTSSGISAASTAGIATVDGSKVGGWWALKSNSGKIAVTPQIDTGPAAYLDAQGRHFDMSYPLGRLFGVDFNQGVYSGFQGIYLGKGAAASASLPGAIAALGGSQADIATGQAAIQKGQSQLLGVGAPGIAGATTPAGGAGCAPPAVGLLATVLLLTLRKMTR